MFASKVVVIVSPLHVGFRDVCAVNFDVDFSVFLLCLLLFAERPSVPDEVERQHEAKHAKNQESNIDLEGKETGIKT